MADIIVPERDPNERAAALGLDILPAGTAEGLSAVFKSTFDRNITPSILRHLERNAYEDITFEDEFGVTRTIPGRPSVKLTAEEANNQYGIPGHLTFDVETPEPVAQSLNELKKQEIEYQTTINRAKNGIASQFSVGLIASLADPLNIAASFIPGVGEANFARLSGQVGVNTARVMKGAADGLLGAALLEPVVLGVATEEQANYTIADSLMNLSIGTVMGGGLHLAAGFVGDRLAGRAVASPVAKVIDELPAQDRAEILGAAVAQVVDGRSVDVSPVFETAIDRHGFDQPYELKVKEFNERAKSVGLTDEQSKALTPPDVRDTVTGFYRAEDRIPTLDRALKHVAETNQPGFYIEADIANLGGLNKAFGHSGANAVYKDLSDIFKQAIEEAQGKAILFRHGGDEISAIVINGDEKSLSTALQEMQTNVNNYIKANNLKDIPHTKEGREGGTGLSYGISPITKGRTIGDIMSVADKQVETSKVKGNVNTKTIGTTGSKSPGKQSNRTSKRVRKTDQKRNSKAKTQSRIKRAEEHATGPADAVNANSSNNFNELVKELPESDLKTELVYLEDEVTTLQEFIPDDLKSSSELEDAISEAAIYEKGSKAAVMCRIGKAI